MRVVLDTNVVVSALLKAAGNEPLVFTAALARKFDLLISPQILAEYEAVLPRPKFKLRADEVAKALAAIRKVGQLVRPTTRLEVASDKKDDPFLECADEGEADYLVTGNPRHFPIKWGKTRVVRARELLELLAPEESR